MSSGTHTNILAGVTYVYTNQQSVHALFPTSISYYSTTTTTTIHRKEVQRCQKREKRLKTVRVRYLYCLLHHLLAPATTINNATQSKVDASCVQDFGTYHSSSSLVDLLLLACPIFVKVKSDEVVVDLLLLLLLSSTRSQILQNQTQTPHEILVHD